MDFSDVLKKLHINLAVEKVEPFLYHSSANDQPKEQALLNKIYVDVGSKALRLLYALNLYIKGEFEGEASLNANINEIVASIHQELQLEQYVIKSKGEQERIHDDIVSKLVAIIYLNFGLFAANQFLTPYFNKHQNFTEEDPRPIVETYAHKFKSKVVYASFNSTYGVLAQNSVLNLCGYTVNSNEGLSAMTRQDILKNFIDNEIIEKYRVIDYL